MKNSVTNPFPVTGYQGPEYFCDRDEELTNLVEAVASGRHTTIVALRRMGKTALVRRLFDSLNDRQYIKLYLDLMPTTNLKALHGELLTALVRAFPERSTMGQRIWKWIRRLRPTMTFDPYTGLPTVSVTFDPAEVHYASIQDGFRLLDGSGKKVVIALDEFQQITQYPENQTEAWLRAQIQRLRNTTFVFSGSQQTLLQEMFASAKRPFYASSQLMPLTYIAPEEYAIFIETHFRNHRRKFPPEQIQQLLTWTRCHTYYVQMTCNKLFGTGEKQITESVLLSTMGQLLQMQESLFYTYRELLTGPQWDLLKAIAREDKLHAPTAQHFLQKHHLGGAATVSRSLKSLLDNELIFRVPDPEGKGFYQVYDVFLSRWLEAQP